MVITRTLLADMLIKYINRKIGISELISWAEDALREAEFEEKSFELIRDILARLGLADVHEFGLTWDECYDCLHKLGYEVKVELTEA